MTQPTPQAAAQAENLSFFGRLALAISAFFAILTNPQLAARYQALRLSPLGTVAPAPVAAPPAPTPPPAPVPPERSHA